MSNASKQTQQVVRRRAPRTQLHALFEVMCDERGWSMSELARRLGITRQGLHAMMKRGNPRIETLRRFAKIFDVHTEQLLRKLTPSEYGRRMMGDQ